MDKELYEAAKEAITALFSDTSVSKEKALENLQGLQDEIQTFIDTINIEEEAAEFEDEEEDEDEEDPADEE